MPPTHLLLAGLLTFSSIAVVDAKNKDRVQVSKFVNGNCDGHPLGKQDELEKDKCMSFQAGSFRVQKHPKGNYNKWINDFTENCFVTAYNQEGCLGEAIAEVSLPADFEGCTKLSSAHTSIKFWCEPNSALSGRAYTTSITVPWTSYSIGNDGRAHGYPTKAQATVTRCSNAESGLADREDTVGHSHLEPRKKKFDAKSVWMKHPWSGSDICYECWTTKSLNYNKIQCYSGEKKPVKCGLKPKHVPISSTATTTTTSTVEFFYTTTQQFVSGHAEQDPVSTGDLDKRSKHKPVVFANPWLQEKFVCAEAKWKHEGKGTKSEIHIKHAKDASKCLGKDTVYLNFDRPYDVSTQTVHKTVATILTTQPAWAPTSQA